MTKDRKEGRRKRKEGIKGKQKGGRKKRKRGKKEKEKKKRIFFPLSLDQQSALALLFCSLSCHVSWFCSSGICFLTEY